MKYNLEYIYFIINTYIGHILWSIWNKHFRYYQKRFPESEEAQWLKKLKESNAKLQAEKVKDQ